MECLQFEGLTWEAHIEHLEKKLNSCIVMIKRIKNSIPKSEYLKIYNALFMSHLSYCISCWGGIPAYSSIKFMQFKRDAYDSCLGRHLIMITANFMRHVLEPGLLLITTPRKVLLLSPLSHCSISINS